VHWGCDYATAVDVEVDPQRRRFAAANPILLFKPGKNAARLKRNESDWLRCYGIPVALKCASVSRWACRKRRLKNSPCMRVEVLTMAGRKEMF
jgi:hypothetical protein